MTLTQYGRVLLAHWWVLAGSVLLGLGLSVGYLLVAPSTYSASTSVFVTTTTATGRPLQLNASARFLARRIPTYAQLPRSSYVLDQVRERAGLTGSAGDLAKTVSVGDPDEGTNLTITVRGPDARRCALVANTIAAVLPGAVGALEDPTGTGAAPVAISVREAATVPRAPASPQRPGTLVLGGLLGLAAGLVLASARHSRAQTVTSVHEVVAITGTIPLVSVPNDRNSSRHIIGGTGAEAYRVLGQRLPVQLPPPGAVLAVVSAAHGEGRTTVAANLAHGLSVAGYSVALVDASPTDRDSGLRRRLGVEHSAGLGAVLRGTATLAESVQLYGSPGFMLLVAGRDGPGELLGADPMLAMVGRLAARYDYVLLDSQPMVGNSLGTSLAAMADSALVVAAPGRTSLPGLEQVLTTLGLVDTTVVGVVLNRAGKAAGAATGPGYAVRDHTERDQSSSARQIEEVQ